MVAGVVGNRPGHRAPVGWEQEHNGIREGSASARYGPGYRLRIGGRGDGKRLVRGREMAGWAGEPVDVFPGNMLEEADGQKIQW